MDDHTINTYRHSVIYKSMVALGLLDANGLMVFPRMALLALVLWGTVFISAIVGGVAWPRTGLDIPMIHDIPLYCNLFVALPLYLYGLSLFDVDAGRFIRWVRTSRRIGVADEELQSLCLTFEKWCRSKWISGTILVAATVSVYSWIQLEFTNGRWSWPSRMTGGTWEIPTIAGGITVVYMIVTGFILGSFALRMGLWIWFLHRLSKSELKIDPIHPDGCGGFAPLNNLQRTLQYVLCGFGVVIVCIVINNCIFLDAPMARFDHAAMITGLIVAAPILFFLPLTFFQRRLWVARREALTWVNTLADRTVTAIMSEIEEMSDNDVLSVGAQLETVEFVGLYRERILTMRALPYDFTSLRTFLGFAYSPLLTLVLPFLPNAVQEVLKLFM